MTKLQWSAERTARVIRTVYGVELLGHDILTKAEQMAIASHGGNASVEVITEATYNTVIAWERLMVDVWHGIASGNARVALRRGFGLATLCCPHEDCQPSHATVERVFDAVGRQ